MAGIAHKVATLAFGFLAMASLVSAQRGRVAVGKPADVEFRQVTRIGATMLQPGHPTRHDRQREPPAGPSARAPSPLRCLGRVEPPGLVPFPFVRITLVRYPVRVIAIQ